MSSTDENRKNFLKSLGRMRRKENFHYDDPENGLKVKKFLQKNRITRINVDQVIKDCVLCSADYLDDNGEVIFEGVRICTRELGDVFNELSDGVPNADLMIELHEKAEKIKLKTNEKIFSENEVSPSMKEVDPPARYKKFNLLFKSGLLSKDDHNKRLLRFTPKEKNNLIEMLSTRVANESIGETLVTLALPNQLSGLTHITVKDKEDLERFLQNVDEYYKECQEIWVIVPDNSKVSYYGRVSLDFKEGKDLLEIGRGKTARILNELTEESKTPLQVYERKPFLKSFQLTKSKNVDDEMIRNSELIRKHIARYQTKFNDLELMLTRKEIDSICLQFVLESDKSITFYDWDGDYRKVMSAFSSFEEENTK